MSWASEEDCRELTVGSVQPRHMNPSPGDESDPWLQVSMDPEE